MRKRYLFLLGQRGTTMRNRENKPRSGNDRNNGQIGRRVGVVSILFDKQKSMKVERSVNQPSQSVD